MKPTAGDGPTTQAQEEEVVYTSVFYQLMKAWQGNKRRFFMEGGTVSTKTYSAMQFLIRLLENYKSPILATVTSESMPHLKRGCIRNFLDIMGDRLIQSRWDKTNSVYTFPKSGCQLEFISDDQPEKWSGPRRHIWFLNELNHIHKRSYMEGDLRTSLFTIADWNPHSEFWFHDEKIAEREENVYVKGLTFRDAPQIVSENAIKAIAQYKDTDPNYYRVHWLGLLGSLEGLVYPKFEQVKVLPESDYFYGLDYGFSSDPTVLVKNVIIGENLYSQEMFYNYHFLTNDDIAREMTLCKVRGNEIVYADSNEPKSAVELQRLGFNVIAIDKAFARVSFGIRKVLSFYHYWTEDSLNCINEQRNYMFLRDKEHEGRFTDKTTHQWSHGMSARRFAVVGWTPKYHGPRPAVGLNW